MYPEIVPINALGEVGQGESPPVGQEWAGLTGSNAYPSGTFFINVLECVPCGKQLRTRKQNPNQQDLMLDEDYDDEGELGTPLALRSDTGIQEHEAEAIPDEGGNENKYESFGWIIEYVDPQDVNLPGELRPYWTSRSVANVR
jgi:hypothetical protein